MDMKRKFRLPSEMSQPEDKRVPVSTRVRESIDLELEKMAKKAKISKTKLIENVLEDYIQYVTGK